MTAQEAREKYRLFVYGGGRIKENLPIDLSEYVKPADADEGTGYYVCTVPKKITVSKEIGNTVYDVTADFDPEGKQSLFQQFKELILNSSQN